MRVHYLRGAFLLVGIALMGLSCPNSPGEQPEGLQTMEEALNNVTKITMEDCDKIRDEYDRQKNDGADHVVLDEIVQRHLECLNEVNQDQTDN